MDAAALVIFEWPRSIMRDSTHLELAKQPCYVAYLHTYFNVQDAIHPLGHSNYSLNFFALVGVVGAAPAPDAAAQQHAASLARWCEREISERLQ